MPETDIDEDDVIICAGCGIEILPVEVAGEFDGRFVDYIIHRQGMANFVFCPGCWDTIVQNLETPPHIARERRQRLIDEINVNRSSE